MNENTALVNLSEISKPATALVEKVSDAIGGICKPWQIRRIALAEADAELIKAKSKLKINGLEHRALQRFINEESKKQKNIEDITIKSLPLVNDNAHPQNMEDDWISNFYDKCRLISDDEMQYLWSKVLAGEANIPGTFSKRTVNLLSSLDKNDAILFRSLCGYCWSFTKNDPVIFDVSNEIYNKNNINFNTLKHLDDIGLLNFDSFGSIALKDIPQIFVTSYYDKYISIKFEFENNNRLNIGHILLSKSGQELMHICDSSPVPGFFDYTINKWSQEGLLITPIQSPKTSKKTRAKRIKSVKVVP
jgi:hypothetical protein